MTRRWIAPLVLLVAGCGGGATPTATPQASGRALGEALDAELERTTEQAGLAGAASVLVVDGRVVWSGATGMADVEAQRPMTARTPVYFASVSKTVTAAVALRLAEQGRLRLDDPVRRWVPEWRGPRTVTLRELLGHTSGVRDPAESFFIDQARYPARRITPRDWLRDLPPRESGRAYANANFILAGLAIKRAAGNDWDRVRHEVAPDLVLQPDERVRGRPARFYWYPNGLGDRQPHGDDAGWVPSTAMATGAWTAGAWAGTTEALARWADRLFRGEVLEPASLEAMTEGGLGLALLTEEGEEVWGHQGHAPGVHTELWHLPDRRMTLFTVVNDDLISGPDQQRALLRVALSG
jgi:D-alanyl-D-alanine carboxypeptidase